MLDVLFIILCKIGRPFVNKRLLLLRLIEDKRKDGFINKEKSKELRKAVIVLFTEFVRISPKRPIKLGEDSRVDFIKDEILNSKFESTPVDVYYGAGLIYLYPDYKFIKKRKL